MLPAKLEVSGILFELLVEPSMHLAVLWTPALSSVAGCAQARVPVGVSPRWRMCARPARSDTQLLIQPVFPPVDPQDADSL